MIIDLVELNEYLIKLIVRNVRSLIIYKYSQVACDESILSPSRLIIVLIRRPHSDLASIVAVMKCICKIIGEYLLYHELICIYVAHIIQLIRQLNFRMVLLHQNG